MGPALLQTTQGLKEPGLRLGMPLKGSLLGASKEPGTEGPRGEGRSRAARPALQSRLGLCGDGHLEDTG